MPQGPIELHEKWGDPSKALEALTANFIDDRGVIRPRNGKLPNEEECSAIDYLCMEWDFGYEPDPIASVKV